MISGKTFVRLGLAFVLSASVAYASPAVVTSIRPIHSLAAAVMEGVAEPTLLIEVGSPHNYSLRPSQARALADAAVVFWVGHEVETFLEKPLKTLTNETKVISLLESEGLTKLEFREGGFFEAHDHEHETLVRDKHDHDKHAHDKHEHDKHEHDKHEHDKHEHDEHEHDEHEHDEHEHGEYDPHVWLDPKNAVVMVNHMAEVLAEIDPTNGATYYANAERYSAELDTLIEEVALSVSPVRGTGFIVFHDAYHYFENRFGVFAVGSVTVSPEVIPGAKRISELKRKIAQSEASCVFAEPQFEPRIVSVLTEDTDAREGILDPLGADLQPGADLYPTLIKNMANAMLSCLGS